MSEYGNMKGKFNNTLKRRNSVLTIQLICMIVSAVILLSAVISGLIGGLRKGALHSLVKLGALILSIVIALIVSLCLRGTVTNLIVSVLPDALDDFEGLIKLVIQLPASIALLAVFWLILTVVRLLMFIPQKIVCKLLPKSFDDIRFKPKKQASAEMPAEQPLPEANNAGAYLQEDMTDASASAENVAAEGIDGFNGVAGSDAACAFDAPSEEGTYTANQSASAYSPSEAAAILQEVEAEINRRPLKILWQVSAALCGALSSLLLLGALLMPISGLVTRAGDSLYRISDTLDAENYGEYSDEVRDCAHALSSAPLFTVTDFFYGKTVFEPLTTFETDYGRISLSDELENATDLACEALPIVIHLQKEGSVQDEDIDHLTATADQLAESKFLMSVATYFVNRAGDGMESDESATAGKRALEEELSRLMSDMDTDGLETGLDTLVSLIDLLADSPLLKALTGDDASLSPSDLTDREMMESLFGILYDDPNTRALLVPVINFATESVFRSMNAEPVYSDMDINQVSREEILEDARRICDAAEGLTEFAESVDADGADIASYQLSAAGKALDSLKASKLFGNRYGEMIDSLTATTAGGADSSLMGELGDALRNSESAEDLLSSAQSMAAMSKALESSEKKGRENEELMSSMDTLLNHTTAENADTLSNIAGNHFMNDTNSVNAETKSQMIEDYMSALVIVSAQEEKDVAAEADAMQVVYDISHSSNTTPFDKVSEEEAVEKMLDSDIAFEMIKELNAEDRDYGIRAKLTDDNRAKIAAAVSADDASAERKDAVETFFGIR